MVVVERRDERPKLVLKGTQDGQCEDTRRMAYHVQRKNDYVRYNDTPLLPLFLNQFTGSHFLYVCGTNTYIHAADTHPFSIAWMKMMVIK